MLLVDHISLKYQREVLHDVTFSIGSGEIVGIVGKSGAGKTSLLKIIAGYLDPVAGSVLFEGKKVLGPALNLVPGHPDIQLVDQDFGLDIYHTVEENIREKILYLPLKERNQLVEELLDLVELTDWRKQQARTLSGGEQQRLAIARALACEPKILLLDEPFVHLDGRLRSKLTNYLLQLRSIRGTSFILVSHDGSEMLALADEVYSMKKGKLVRKGKPRDLYYRSKTIEDALLFGAVNVVNFNGKRTFFRPDEYEISNENNPNSFPVEFDHSLFTGPVHENYFVTKRKERIVLYSFSSLENVRAIEIKKK